MENMIYKKSYYNLIVKDKSIDKHIYFNTLTGNMFSVKKNDKMLIDDLLSDINNKKNEYPNLFEVLLQKGFIVNGEWKELDVIRVRNKNGVFLDRNYHFFINPTLECNFNCWYCYENHPKGRMSNETIKIVKQHLEYMIKVERINGLNLSWFGGEPLLYFSSIVYEISLFAKTLCEDNNIPFVNQITTNGYLITPSIINKMSEIKLNKFQITFDGNEEEHDKIRFIKNNHKGSFRKIINNMKNIIDKLDDVFIILRINYTDITLKTLDSIFDEFEPKYRSKIQISFQRVWQTYDKIISNSTNPNLLNCIDKCKIMGYNVKDLHFTINKEKVCYVDKLFHLEMNWDGKIYKCTARGYDDKYVVGKINDSGKIDWKPESLMNHFSTSTFDNRMCIKCKLLPICMGPCVQKVIESKENNIKNMCYLNFTEISVKEYIIRMYKDRNKSNI